MFHVRCGRRSCRKRDKLRMYPDDYKYQKCRQCKHCGGNLNFDPEPQRRHLRESCDCDGILWPHRIRTVIDEEQYCRAVSAEDARAVVMARAMGSTARRMRPDEPVPF